MNFFDVAQLGLIVLGSLWLSSIVARVVQWNAGVCFLAILCLALMIWKIVSQWVWRQIARQRDKRHVNPADPIVNRKNTETK